MAWFTLYLLNLLWATAGTSTESRSSCCEYAVSQGAQGGRYPGDWQGTHTAGSADEEEVRNSGRYRNSKMSASGCESVWFICPHLIA